MKKFTLIILVTFFAFSSTAHARTKSHAMFKKIEKQLQRLREHCPFNPKPAHIFVDDFPIHEDKILLFIATQDYTCIGANTHIPVLIENTKPWKIGKNLDGSPNYFHQTSQGRFWLESRLYSAGVISNLYTSQDGFNWEMVALPDHSPINTNIFVITDIHVTDDVVAINYPSPTALHYKIKLPYTKDSQWQPITKAEFLKIKKQKKTKTSLSWQRNETETHTVFSNSKSNQEIRIPKFLNE